MSKIDKLLKDDHNKFVDNFVYHLNEILKPVDFQINIQNNLIYLINLKTKEITKMETNQLYFKIYE